MSALSEIESYNEEWKKTESFKAFAKWYSSIGIQMNVKNVCHDHLCGGIWRGIEKWMHEEQMKLLETQNAPQLNQEPPKP